MNKDRPAIMRLMNEYCYRVDQGDFEGFAALFENARFEVLGDPDGARHGKQAVLSLLENVTLYDGVPHTKHVLSNVQIDIDESGLSATAQSYITVFQALPPDFPLQAIFLGHYHDTFARTGDEWQFRSRTISPDLIGDLSRHRADMA